MTDKQIIIEQECGELKKRACRLQPEPKYVIEKVCREYNIETKNYHEKIVEIINNLDKYKQTLTEIKKISESCSFADSSKLLLKRIKVILHEISEVENENK